jgi:predicted nucleic acid-binding protein
MPRVVLDTDFLSALLKIDRISLVSDYFQTRLLSITPAVYAELAATDLLSRHSTAEDELELEVVPPPAAKLAQLRENSSFSALGPGEPCGPV